MHTYLVIVIYHDPVGRTFSCHRLDDLCLCDLHRRSQPVGPGRWYPPSSVNMMRQWSRMALVKSITEPVVQLGRR